MKENVIINFSRFPFCFRCTRVKKHNFTNYLKDNKDFFDKFKEIMEQIIPHLMTTELNNLFNAGHVHPIGNHTKEYECVKEIVKNLCMNYNN